MVSIIIPVYNTSSYLRQCIDSCINQTYSDIEVLLIDDGSTDESGSICDEYANNDSRIIVNHLSNGGQGRARNIALDLAKGEYLFFLDSDDYIELDYVEKALKICIDGKLDVLHSAAIFFDNDTNESKYVCDCNNTDETISGYDFLLQNVGKIDFTVWSLFYKREILDSTRFLEGIILEDNNFYYESLLKAKRVATCKNAYYHYRCKRASSTTGSDITYKAIKGYCTIMADIVSKFEPSKQKDIKLYELTRQYIAYWFVCMLEHYKRIPLLSRMSNNTLVQYFKDNVNRYSLYQQSSIINFCRYGELYTCFSQVMDKIYRL